MFGDILVHWLIGQQGLEKWAAMQVYQGIGQGYIAAPTDKQMEGTTRKIGKMVDYNTHVWRRQGEDINLEGMLHTFCQPVYSVPPRFVELLRNTEGAADSATLGSCAAGINGFPGFQETRRHQE